MGGGGGSDVKRAKFSGTGMPGHCTLWQGQNGQCPFKIFLARALTIGQRALNGHPKKSFVW